MTTEEPFKIYIDRLQDNHVERIEEEVSSEFLDITEADLTFFPIVKMSGEVYKASDHLILHLKIKIDAILPCSVCNEPVITPIILQNFYHTEDLATLKSSVYDFSAPLRDVILLNTPDFTECHDGFCPERKSLKKFLHKEDEPAPTHQQFPFSDLDQT